MKTGALMKACRERAGYTQEHMADLLQVDQATVSRLENGRQEPSLSIMTNWAKLTSSKEVMVAYLFGVDGVLIMQHIMNQKPIEARAQ